MHIAIVEREGRVYSALNGIKPLGIDYYLITDIKDGLTEIVLKGIKLDKIVIIGNVFSNQTEMSVKSDLSEIRKYKDTVSFNMEVILIDNGSLRKVYDSVFGDKLDCIHYVTESLTLPIVEKAIAGVDAVRASMSPGFSKSINQNTIIQKSKSIKKFEKKDTTSDSLKQSLADSVKQLMEEPTKPQKKILTPLKKIHKVKEISETQQKQEVPETLQKQEAISKEEEEPLVIEETNVEEVMDTTEEPREESQSKSEKIISFPNNAKSKESAVNLSKLFKDEKDTPVISITKSNKLQDNTTAQDKSDKNQSKTQENKKNSKEKEKIPISDEENQEISTSNPRVNNSEKKRKDTSYKDNWISKEIKMDKQLSNLVENILAKNPRILVLGDRRSGKTMVSLLLCKYFEKSHVGIGVDLDTVHGDLSIELQRKHKYDIVSNKSVNGLINILNGEDLAECLLLGKTDLIANEGCDDEKDYDMVIALQEMLYTERDYDAVIYDTDDYDVQNVEKVSRFTSDILWIVDNTESGIRNAIKLISNLEFKTSLTKSSFMSKLKLILNSRNNKGDSIWNTVLESSKENYDIGFLKSLDQALVTEIGGYYD